MFVSFTAVNSRRVCLAALLVSVFLGGSALAAPPKPAPKPSAASGKAACVAAHEQAQSLRTEKKLHAAREKYVTCARAECPVVLRKECTEQLDQIETVAPTVALEALDDKGSSDSQVKVTVDGQVVAERLTGTALAVEPGEHVFVFERASDKKTLEQRVLVVEGEKNRKVVADFQTLLPKPKIAEGGSSGTQAQPQAPEKRVPALAYVAGGGAVLALGSFVFFSLSGKGTEDDLATKCAPRCTADDVSPVKRDYLIADISLAVALVATAAAVVLALPAFQSSKTSASRDNAPARPWMPLVRVAR
jgi:hypothetical protein